MGFLFADVVVGGDFAKQSQQFVDGAGGLADGIFGMLRFGAQKMDLLRKL